MSIKFNDNVKINAGKPIDSKYLSTGNTTYGSIALVNSTIPIPERHIGLTVNVNNVEYWYKDGVADINLVEKITGSVVDLNEYITGATNNGFFSGKTGIQTLALSGFPTGYDGLYYSEYNNYYRDSNGYVRLGTAEYNGVNKRAYVNSTRDKSWIYNYYTGNTNRIGWILTPVDVSSNIGSFVTGVNYTGTVYANETWSGFTTNTRNSVTATGSLTTGNTYTIGGPVYYDKTYNRLNLRTLKSKNTSTLSITHDDYFIYISGATAGTITGASDGSNLGGGIGVFNSKSGSTLTFNTLYGTGSTIISKVGNKIYINSTGGTGSGTITGGTNGLGVSSNGRNLCLGGSLTKNTCISGGDNYNIKFNSLSGFNFGNSNTYITGSSSNCNIMLNAKDAYLDVNNLNYPNISVGGRTGFLGIIYDDDYSSNYTDRSLVDKAYVEAVAIGLNTHTSVLVATTEDITLAGLQTIDGVSLSEGNRVLVKDQSVAMDNGIYNASSSVWTRSSDYNFTPSGEIANGDLIPIISGTTQNNSLWAMTSPNPIISGDSLNFTFFSKPTSMIGGTGITISINKVSVNGPVLVGNSLIWTGNTFNVNVNSGTLKSSLDSKTNVSLFNQYTGDTKSFLDITLTGSSNGICKYDSHNVCLGGTLSSNVTINANTKTLSINGGYLSTSNGYQVSGNTILRTSSGSTSSVYLGHKSGFNANGTGNTFIGLCSGYNETGNNKLYISNSASNPLICGDFSDRSLLINGQLKISGVSDGSSISDSIVVWNSGSCLLKKISPIYKNKYQTCKITTNGYETVSTDHFIGISGASCIYLIASPSYGQSVIINDVCGNALSAPITIDGNGNNINNGSTSTINTNYGSISFIYNDSGFWSVVGFVN